MCRPVIPIVEPDFLFLIDLCALIPGSLLLPHTLADPLHPVGAAGRLPQSVDLLANKKVDELHGLRLQVPLLDQLSVKLRVSLLLSLLVAREVSMQALNFKGQGLNRGGVDWLDQ